METKQKAKTAQAAVAASTANVAAAESGEHNKMDQIRELMFGGVVRDFERRLKELTERLESDVARISEDYQKRIAALESRLDPQIERLQGQLRQEVAARTGALDDVDTRFNQALRTQRGELNAVLQRHEDDAAAAEARTREALAQLEEQIKLAIQGVKDNLSSARTQLAGEKLAREDLADLMAELSLRLRGTQDAVGND